MMIGPLLNDLTFATDACLSVFFRRDLCGESSAHETTEREHKEDSPWAFLVVEYIFTCGGEAPLLITLRKWVVQSS
jgi:hypothetical protein